MAQLRGVPAGASVTSAGKIVLWSTPRPGPLRVCLSGSWFFRDCETRAQRGAGRPGFHTEREPGVWRSPRLGIEPRSNPYLHQLSLKRRRLAYITHFPDTNTFSFCKNALPPKKNIFKNKSHIFQLMTFLKNNTFATRQSEAKALC